MNEKNGKGTQPKMTITTTPSPAPSSSRHLFDYSVLAVRDLQNKHSKIHFRFKTTNDPRGGPAKVCCGRVLKLTRGDYVEKIQLEQVVKLMVNNYLEYKKSEDNVCFKCAIQALSLQQVNERLGEF